jgi:hypothetical protein
MSAHRKYKFSSVQLGRVYSMTRQNICYLIGKFGAETLEEPDRLFETLVVSGRRSRLRKTLSDPQARAQVAAAIKGLSNPSPLPAC